MEQYAGEQNSQEGSQRTPVLVRVRPLSAGEAARHGKEAAVRKTDDGRIQLKHKDQVSSFQFTSGVLDATASQSEVYEAVGPSVLEALYRGRNVFIITCGQRESGKTYSLHGDLRTMPYCSGTVETGLVPRVLEKVFEGLADGTDGTRPQGTHDNAHGTHISVKCTFLMVRDEQVVDLLCPVASPVETEPVAGSYELDLSGVTETELKSADEGLDMLLSALRTSATSPLATAPAHTLLTVRVRGLSGTGDGEAAQADAGDKADSGSTLLTFVDLAGWGTGPQVVEQGATEEIGSTEGDSTATLFMSDDLMAFWRTATKVSESQGCALFHQNAVSFGACSLTKLLQPAFERTVHTVLLTTVSPCVADAPQTRATLQFAEKMQGIRRAPLPIATAASSGPRKVTLPSLKGRPAMEVDDAPRKAPHGASSTREGSAGDLDKAVQAALTTIKSTTEVSGTQCTPAFPASHDPHVWSIQQESFDKASASGYTPSAFTTTDTQSKTPTLEVSYPTGGPGSSPSPLRPRSDPESTKVQPVVVPPAVPVAAGSPLATPYSDSGGADSLALGRDLQDRISRSLVHRQGYVSSMLSTLQTRCEQMEQKDGLGLVAMARGVAVELSSFVAETGVLRELELAIARAEARKAALSIPCRGECEAAGTLRVEMQRVKDELRARVVEVEHSVEAAKASHGAKLREARERHARELKAAKDRAGEALAEAKREAAQEMKTVLAQHKEEIQSMRRWHDRTRNKDREMVSDQIHRAQEAQRIAADQQLRAAADQHQQEIVRIQREAGEAKKIMEWEMDGLRSQVLSLRAANARMEAQLRDQKVAQLARTGAKEISPVASHVESSEATVERDVLKKELTQSQATVKALLVALRERCLKCPKRMRCVDKCNMLSVPLTIGGKPSMLSVPAPSGTSSATSITTESLSPEDQPPAPPMTAKQRSQSCDRHDRGQGAKAYMLAPTRTLTSQPSAPSWDMKSGRSQSSSFYCNPEAATSGLVSRPRSSTSHLSSLQRVWAEMVDGMPPRGESLGDAVPTLLENMCEAAGKDRMAAAGNLPPSTKCSTTQVSKTPGSSTRDARTEGNGNPCSGDSVPVEGHKLTSWGEIEQWHEDSGGAEVGGGHARGAGDPALAAVTDTQCDKFCSATGVAGKLAAADRDGYVAREQPVTGDGSEGAGEGESVGPYPEAPGSNGTQGAITFALQPEQSVGRSSSLAVSTGALRPVGPDEEGPGPHGASVSSALMSSTGSEERLMWSKVASSSQPTTTSSVSGRKDGSGILFQRAASCSGSCPSAGASGSVASASGTSGNSGTCNSQRLPPRCASAGRPVPPALPRAPPSGAIPRRPGHHGRSVSADAVVSMGGTRRSASPHGRGMSPLRAVQRAASIGRDYRLMRSAARKSGKSASELPVSTMELPASTPSRHTYVHPPLERVPSPPGIQTSPMRVGSPHRSPSPRPSFSSPTSPCRLPSPPPKQRPPSAPSPLTLPNASEVQRVPRMLSPSRVPSGPATPPTAATGAPPVLTTEHSFSVWEPGRNSDEVPARGDGDRAEAKCIASPARAPAYHDSSNPIAPPCGSARAVSLQRPSQGSQRGPTAPDVLPLQPPVQTTTRSPSPKITAAVPSHLSASGHAHMKPSARPAAWAPLPSRQTAALPRGRGELARSVGRAVVVGGRQIPLHKTGERGVGLNGKPHGASQGTLEGICEELMLDGV